MVDGTGTRAQIDGLTVAGKTGTAQKVDLVKGGYLKGSYISSFAGFVPAHDPRIDIVSSARREGHDDTNGFVFVEAILGRRGNGVEKHDGKS